MGTEAVGAYEAKTHLPQLLDKVVGGRSLVITRRGIPVARLVPAEAPAKPAPEETVAALRAARRGMRLGGLSVREMVEEGRH